MKIITKKQMYIGELLEYLRKNKIELPQKFDSAYKGRSITFYPDGDISFNSDSYYSPDDTFIVKAEEQLTEETNLKGLILIGLGKYTEIEGYKAYTWSNTTCIKNIKSTGIDLKSLHIINKDGTFTLIYTEENGIPEDGVLEVFK